MNAPLCSNGHRAKRSLSNLTQRRKTRGIFAEALRRRPGDERKKPALIEGFLGEILSCEALADARVEATVPSLPTSKRQDRGRACQTLCQPTARRLLPSEQADPAALSGSDRAVYVQRYYQRFADDIAEFEETAARSLGRAISRALCLPQTTHPFP